MRKIRKAYLSPADLDYVRAAKLHLSQLLLERGWNAKHLAALSHIPASTISRWLSPEREEFMSLADAAVLSRLLRLPLAELFPPEPWSHEGGRLDPALRQLYTLPPKHLYWLLGLYHQARKLFQP